MTDVVFYFQVHQPHRVRRYPYFDIGCRRDYFDDAENARIVKRVAEKCYLPMNNLLRRLIDQKGTNFRCAFSITGTALDQLERHAPAALASFVDLASTGSVEFLAETYYHSLAGLFNLDEFRAQIAAHTRRIQELFGHTPRVFRNTELAFDNRVAKVVEELGYAGLLGEGADRVLGWRSPHRVYQAAACRELKLLLRSYRLSDDIAFRFQNRAWESWPLTAEKFATWLGALPDDDKVVGLFMDYETFGEHQWADCGIFQFMEQLPAALLAGRRARFATPSETLARHAAEGAIDYPDPVSWADTERDLSAWLGNDMQRAAERALYSLRPRLSALEDRESPHSDGLLEDWRRLSTSDHPYYMCTKYFSDGDVHKYFSPYSSPHDAYIYFMNVVGDLTRRIETAERGLDRVATSVNTVDTPIVDPSPSVCP